MELRITTQHMHPTAHHGVRIKATTHEGESLTLRYPTGQGLADAHRWVAANLASIHLDNLHMIVSEDTPTATGFVFRAVDGTQEGK